MIEHVPHKRAGETTAISKPARWLVYLATVGLFLYCISAFYDRATGFTELIGFGERFAARSLPAVTAIPHHVYRQSAGYDGQFYAQMATDPLLRELALDRALDDAPLRVRRILFSWTAYVAGLGHPPWILQAYALQNVVCWLLLSALLLRLFPLENGRMIALWMACLFTGGLIWSVRFALLDGPSLLLLALGIAALDSGRGWLSAAIFGVSGLGRETNLLAVAAQLRPVALAWRPIAMRAAEIALVLLPLVIWFDYIYSIYRSLLYTSGSTLGQPLAAFAWKWQVTLAEVAARGWQANARFSLLTLIALSVQVAYVAIRFDWRNAWWRLGAAYALLMPLLGRALWNGEPPTALRVLLPLAIAFNVLLRDCERPRLFWPLFIAGNATVVQGLAMLRVPFIWSWL
jgi:hypothetical protein